MNSNRFEGSLKSENCPAGDCFRVSAHLRRRSGSTKKRTHIREGKERAELSKKTKMDPETFRAINQLMDQDKENFRVEQRNQEMNELNALAWNNFRNDLRARPKRPKIQTREQAKQDRARKYQAEYIEAVNNLERPIPIRFL